MIKAKARRGDGALVVVGLSRANLAQLRDGRPLEVNLEEMGFSGIELVIFAGESDRDMVRQIAPRLADDVEVRAHFDEEPTGHA